MVEQGDGSQQPEQAGAMASKGGGKSSAPSKEIARVFKYLCNYSKKRQFIHQVRKKKERQKKLQAYLRRSDSQPLDATGKPLSMADIDDELASLERQIAEHEEKIDAINRDSVQKIDSSDLMLTLKDLGSVHSKQEVEDMIWEVDEGLDGMVDWTEFMLMYDRNVNDQTGLEPCQLYDAVQFMMYDTDMSGTVSVDETMTMLYQRYGKKKLETELQRLFGNTLKAEDGIGELSFQQYLKAVKVKPSVLEDPKLKKRKDFF